MTFPNKESRGLKPLENAMLDTTWTERMQQAVAGWSSDVGYSTMGSLVAFIAHPVFWLRGSYQVQQQALILVTNLEGRKTPTF